MKFVLILVAIFCEIASFGFFAKSQERFISNPAHFLESTRTIVTGLGSQVLGSILSPKDSTRGAKQLLVGLPEVAVFKAFNELCSLYLNSGSIDPMVTPNIEEMYFQLRTPCDSVSVPIRTAATIFNTNQFDVNKPIVLFITGWTSTIESDTMAHMAKAFNCRGGYNFFALNASHSIDTLYTWSAFNTDRVGHIVAQGLVQLSREVPAENIYLIGFSLGAHIAGFAARYFEEATGEKIQRITGLDPANPCFGGRSLAGLQRGDANFVDVIHTNPGVLGERDALGDIDFYVEGYAPIKPGCLVPFCSHMRAWQYYAESVYPGHEKDFVATRCSSLRNVANGKCNGPEVVMGLKASSNTKGSYMLSVNREVPYGQNSPYNADLILSECGFCGAQ